MKKQLQKYIFKILQTNKKHKMKITRIHLQINCHFFLRINAGIPKGQPGQSRANKRSPPDEVLEINFGQNTLPE